MGVFENGTTYPLYDNYRPIQEHNYTQSPVYECGGEDRDEPMIDQCTCDDDSDDDDDDDDDAEFGAEDDDDDEMWNIIGIVFICLFAVSVLLIAFLLWKLECCAGNGDSSGGHKAVHTHNESEMVSANGNK